METVIQIRIDKELKDLATKTFASMGLDLSTAIRIYLRKTVLEKGLPFNLKLQETDKKFDKTIKEIHAISKANGNDKMTLDEINEIIAETRRLRKEKNK